MEGHSFVIAFCVKEKLDAADSPGDNSQKGKERMQDASCRPLSSGSTRDLNPVFILSPSDKITGLAMYT